MNKTITIYDIAKEAGVSPATVSRVLTKNAKVSEAKKDKIMALIEKYNFRPNLMARRLSDSKTMTIGVLTADIRNPYYAALFIECEKRAIEKGYSLLLYNSLNQNVLEYKHLEKLAEQQVDAIILIGGKVDELVSDLEYVSRVNDISVKAPVLVTGKLDGADCYQININQQEAMDLLLEHLIEGGHERIALLGGNASVQSTIEKRLRFKQTLLKNGLPYYEDYVSKEVGYEMIDGYNEMKRIMALDIKPSAVVAINDYAAVGVVKAIREHGMSIPEDIALVSFDNTYIADLGLIGLTSVDYNFENYGQMLVDSAIELIEGNSVDKIQYVTSRLIVRESSFKQQ